MWQSFKSYWSGHYYTPIKTHTMYPHTHAEYSKSHATQLLHALYTACTTLMNYSWANRNAGFDWFHRKVGGDLPKNNKKVKTRRCKCPRPWWDLNQRNRAPASVRSLQACTVFAVHNRNIGCVWPRNTNGLGTKTTPSHTLAPLLLPPLSTSPPPLDEFPYHWSWGSTGPGTSVAPISYSGPALVASSSSSSSLLFSFMSLMAFFS